MSPMALVLVPLILTVIALIAGLQLMRQVADEAAQLRTALARVRDLGPVAADIGAGARRLGSGIAGLGR